MSDTLAISTTAGLDADTLIRASIFSRSRLAAAVLCAGPETGFREGWFPRLARQFVRNADDPPLGYPSRADAIEAARRYRDACREMSGG